MACDLQYSDMGNGTKWKGGPKIFRFKASKVYHQPFIAGMAGSADFLVQCHDFFNDPDTFPPPPISEGCRGLVLTANGDIWTFENCLRWLRVRQPFMAIGSGAELALGAIATGATPKEAVKIASERDLYTGLGISTLSLD